MVRFICGVLAFSATLSALAAPPLAGAPNGRPAGGWAVEKDVDAPSYAVTQPTRSDLNIDHVVLMCERGQSRPVLQLRLYLSGNGPLAPVGAANLKDDPRFEIVIDGVSHAGKLMFADDFVVVADSDDGTVPLVSSKLLDALQAGRQMELRFRYIQQTRGHVRTRPVDATAIVDLQAGPGGAAVAAVRRCAGDTPAAPEVAHAPAGRTR